MDKIVRWDLIKTILIFSFLCQQLAWAYPDYFTLRPRSQAEARRGRSRFDIAIMQKDAGYLVGVALRDIDSSRRDAAVEALKTMPEKAVGPLLACIFEEGPEMREKAVMLLLKLPKTAAREAAHSLTTAVLDVPIPAIWKDLNRRNIAERVILDHEDMRLVAADALVGALHDNRPERMEKAKIFLLAMPHEAVIPLKWAIAESEEQAVADTAVDVVLRMKEGDIYKMVEWMINIAWEDLPGPRRDALIAKFSQQLGKDKAPAKVEAIAKLRKERAVKFLLKIPDKVIKRLNAIIIDSDKATARETAINIILQMSEGDRRKAALWLSLTAVKDTAKKGEKAAEALINHFDQGLLDSLMIIGSNPAEKAHRPRVMELLLRIPDKAGRRLTSVILDNRSMRDDVEFAFAALFEIFQNARQVAEAIHDGIMAGGHRFNRDTVVKIKNGLTQITNPALARKAERVIERLYNIEQSNGTTEAEIRASMEEHGRRLNRQRGTNRRRWSPNPFLKTPRRNWSSPDDDELENRSPAGRANDYRPLMSAI